MSLIEIKKVETKKDLKTFIDFHYDLYEGNEYDVPNLFSDDMNTLSKDKNAAFEFCEAEYFLAYKDGKLAGRVAAIINHKANNKWGRKSVRFGWIDFIDDREVSRALLDAVEKYGKEKGMEDIAVLADIQVKHGKLMYPETTIEESAYFAERQGADAVIVTGNTTGEETPLDTIRRVKDIVKIPVVVGSGVRKETIAAQMEAAEGFIIGSSIKEGGKLAKPVNEKMALALADAKKMAECSI